MAEALYGQSPCMVEADHMYIGTSSRLILLLRGTSILRAIIHCPVFNVLQNFVQFINLQQSVKFLQIFQFNTIALEYSIQFIGNQHQGRLGSNTRIPKQIQQRYIISICITNNNQYTICRTQNEVLSYHPMNKQYIATLTHPGLQLSLRLSLKIRTFQVAGQYEFRKSNRTTTNKYNLENPKTLNPKIRLTYLDEHVNRIDFTALLQQLNNFKSPTECLALSKLTLSEPFQILQQKHKNLMAQGFSRVDILTDNSQSPVSSGIF